MQAAPPRAMLRWRPRPTLERGLPARSALNLEHASGPADPARSALNLEHSSGPAPPASGLAPSRLPFTLIAAQPAMTAPSDRRRPTDPIRVPGCLDRRDFLRASAAALAALLVGARRLAAAAAPAAVGLRFGLVTDVHYADMDPHGKNFHRESLGKLREAVERLRADGAAFLAELGDFKHMQPGEPEARTLSHLIAIEREFRRFGGPTYHVLGNHDLDNLSKAQVLAQLTNTGIDAGRTSYAFTRGGVRFVVLDEEFTRDGRPYDHDNFDWRDTNVPPPERAWLRAELAAATTPVIVLVHQRLDGDGDLQVVNRAEIRAILEQSRRVLAVFQGHDHRGAYSRIGGIHYYTLRAMVEGSGPANNSYALVQVHPDLSLTVTGYRRAVSMELAPPGA